jgi:hypothetical protein
MLSTLAARHAQDTETLDTLTHAQDAETLDADACARTLDTLTHADTMGTPCDVHCPRCADAKQSATDAKQSATASSKQLYLIFLAAQQKARSLGFQD